MSQPFAILSFNSGELSPKIDNRIDIEKYRSGCRRLENMIPTKYGGAEKRPGLAFINDSTTAANGLTTTTIRMIPFIYSTEVAYSIEVGHKYMRFFYGDAVLEDESSNEVWIATPYEEDDIFQLKFRQIADVMRITHPYYHPRTLSRTGVYTFELEEIDFRDGPFLTRNDLINPSDPSETTLECNVTEAGAVGILTSNNDIFLSGHEGALFQLWHPRATKEDSISGVGAAATVYSEEFRGKGTYTLVTRGSWAGSVTWEQKEESGDWEELDKWRSSVDGYQNFKKVHVEETNTIKHRIKAVATTQLRADFKIDEPLEYGIVKVLSILNGFQASIEVYTPLASTDATLRWNEGAWSQSRGYPGTVTFFENRCCYAGASRSLDDDEFSASDYPALRL